MPQFKALSVPALALADAFFADPFYQAISIDFVTSPARRRAVLAAYFSYALAEARRTGRCVLPRDPALGAAAWLWPLGAQAEAEASAAKQAFLVRTLGPRGYDNYRRIVDFMGVHTERAVPAPACYLSILGISPAAQGHGLGATLLAPTLAEADAAGLPCYLETFAPRSLPFYERRGFYRTARQLEPVTRAVYEIMVRPLPAAAAHTATGPAPRWP